jgi:hypothetical protein
VKPWEVWLGHRASGWAHNGYRVVGQTVYVPDAEDAFRIVRVEYPDCVWANAEDGDYIYRTKADMDADTTGTKAVAVVRDPVQARMHD